MTPARMLSDAAVSYRRSSAHELVTWLGDPLRRLLVVIRHPPRQLDETVFEADLRLVAELRACERQIGDAVADIALAITLRILRRDRHADRVGQQVRDVFDPVTLTAADVERAPGDLRGRLFEREPAGLHRVADMDEVA